MSSEVDWVLDQIESVSNAQPGGHPMKRVNRDTSEVLEDDLRKLTNELKQANYVGATLADRAPSPLGLEFDRSLETIVGVRIVGLSHEEWGHADPNGIDGVAFDDLVHDVQTALQEAREFPDSGRTGVDYHTLLLENDSPLSSDYQDLFRYDFDCRFVGYEELP